MTLRELNPVAIRNHFKAACDSKLTGRSAFECQSFGDEGFQEVLCIEQLAGGENATIIWSLIENTVSGFDDERCCKGIDIAPARCGTTHGTFVSNIHVD